MQRTLFAASLALALTLTLAPRAEAQDIGGAVTGVAIGSALGLTSLGFAIADVVSFAQDSPFDVGLAVADFVVGMVSISGGIALACFVADRDDHSPVLPAFSAASIALGVLQIVHGGWSLAARHHGEAPPPTLAVAPTSGGAMVSISGSF